MAGDIGRMNKWARLGAQYLPGLVQRALGISGDVDARLDWSYQLGVTAVDLTDPQFFWLGRGKRFIGGQIMAGGGAGNFTTMILSNLTAGPSKRLVVVRSFGARNNAGVAQHVVFSLWNGGAIIAGTTPSTRIQGLDSRQDAPGSPATAVPVAIWQTGSAAVIGPAANAVPWFLPIDGVVDFVRPGSAIVVAPGHAIMAQILVANSATNWFLEWEERDATEYE